jgi:hypothetical protein
MQLHILFGQRQESYPDEHSPEPLLCWSGYEIEENPDDFDADVERTRRERAKDFQATRLVIIRIEDKALARVFSAPILAGEIVQ